MAKTLWFMEGFFFPLQISIEIFKAKLIVSLISCFSGDAGKTIETKAAVEMSLVGSGE
jgi:hypothetical protein